MDLVQAAREVLTPLGFEVLELTVSGQGNSQRVRLRIDRLDEQTVSVDDVTLASEVFGLELDRLDPFPGEYRLDVESPGPKRPLVSARHFERFHDLKAKVKVGNESFTGIIREVSESAVRFEVDTTSRTVRLSEIDSATLAEWPNEPR